MSRRLTLAAAGLAALIAAPALAQEAPAPAPAPEAARPAPTAEELAMQSAAQAFGERMNAMGVEINAAVQAAVEAGADGEAAAAAADGVTARYQADIEAFAVQAESFFRQQAERPEAAAQRDMLLARGAEAATEVRGIPAQVHAQVLQQVTAFRASEASAPAAAQ